MLANPSSRLFSFPNINWSPYPSTGFKSLICLPLCLNRSFFLLHTHLRPSLKSRQHLDSSVQSTPWIWLIAPFDTTFSKLGATIAMFQGQRWAQCRFPGTHTVPHHEVDFVRIVKTPSCAPTDIEKISFNHCNGPCSFFDAWLHVKMH